MCIGHHISDLEYHRQNCPIKNSHRKPDSSNPNRERERREEDLFAGSSSGVGLNTNIRLKETLKDYFRNNGKLMFIDLSKDEKYLLLYFGNDEDDINRLEDLITTDIKSVRQYLKDNNKITLERSEVLKDKDQNQEFTVNKSFTTKLYEFYQTPTF
jgi:hypothetical protein